MFYNLSRKKVGLASFKAPTAGSIDIQLSFKITNKLEFSAPAWFKASKAIPAVIDPSPITAICCLFFSPLTLEAIPKLKNVPESDMKKYEDLAEELYDNAKSTFDCILGKTTTKEALNIVDLSELSGCFNNFKIGTLIQNSINKSKKSLK